ncbi:MAG: NrfD/PsrC family molybdoenzyme membrane anchor subunit [Bacteroidota bacterium]
MEHNNQKLVEQVERELLSTIGQKYKNERFWIGLLTVISLFGVGAWIYQLKRGLGVTGMRDYVSWGLYIALLFFFVGISLIGALVSSVLRFTGTKWRYPLLRIAEAVTLSAILFAGVMPVLDMGHPERLYYLVTNGRIQSPILWDVLAIATYFTGSLIYFYLPLVPDLALMRDKLTGISKFRVWLNKFMAINWTGTPLQHKLLKRAMGIISVVILPCAISVHTISAWLIAMTMRTGWNTSIMGPYFVFGALMAGCAMMILVMALLRNGYRLQHYLGHTHFDKLGMLLLALTAFYLYLNINKYGVPAYNMEKDEKEFLDDLMFGRYKIPFWFVQIGGLVIPIILLSFKKIRSSIRYIVPVAALVMVGAIVNRYLIVVPNMLHPFVPIQHPLPGYDSYNPTWIEWAISTAGFTGFILFIILLFKPFPVITIWETMESVEKNGVDEVGLEYMSNQKYAPRYENYEN